jgi:hypothetical protein
VIRETNKRILIPYQWSAKKKRILIPYQRSAKKNRRTGSLIKIICRIPMFVEKTDSSLFQLSVLVLLACRIQLWFYKHWLASGKLDVKFMVTVTCSLMDAINRTLKVLRTQSLACKTDSWIWRVLVKLTNEAASCHVSQQPLVSRRLAMILCLWCPLVYSQTIIS